MGVVSTLAETATKGIKKAVTKGSKKALKTTAKQVVPEVVETGLSKSGKNFMANNFPEIDQIAYDSLQPNSKSYNEINNLINMTADGDKNASTLLSSKLSDVTLNNQKLTHAQQLNNNQFAQIQEKYPDRSIYNKPPSTKEGRDPFIAEHELESAKQDGKIPYFLGDDKKLYYLDTKKLDEYGPGKHRYAMSR